MQHRVFWQKFTENSEEYTISIFRVEGQTLLGACFLFGFLINPEDGSGTVQHQTTCCHIPKYSYISSS
jgi:hypothetical protein